MSVNADVFEEHDLRIKLLDLLDEYAKDLRKLAVKYGRTVWPPPTMQWDELQESRLLTSGYVDDMIKEIRDVREAV